MRSHKSKPDLLRPGGVSAKGERKSVHTRIEKLDLELSIHDGASLSDQLIHPGLGNRAVALFVYVNPVSRARRLPIDEHAKSHGRSWRGTRLMGKSSTASDCLVCAAVDFVCGRRLISFGWFSASRCITGKDKVGRFGLLMAGEAAFHKRRVTSFAVREVTEPPAAGCSILG